MITIYHNPRCSKSREALALVEKFAASSNQAIDVVEYLKTPPTLAQLTMLRGQLGTGVGDMVRTNEDEYLSLNLAQADDDALLRALAAHPKLLQRPLVVYQERALIARPPELLSDFLPRY
ncbi:MAG: arsenate reductase (glutaredoxin) [Noviherbaspirillum sp.]